MQTETLTCARCGAVSASGSANCSRCGSPLIGTGPYTGRARSKLRMGPVRVVLVVLAAIALYVWYTSRPDNSVPNLASTSQTSRLNSNIPTNIMDVVAYREADKALMVYLAFLDTRGAMTTADGTARIEVMEESNGRLSTIFQRMVTVRKSDFVETEMGQGSSKELVIVWPMGRLEYSSFERMPDERSGTLTVTVTFMRTDGRLIYGAGSVISDP